MNIKVNDSYIYKYLDQQHQRDIERTKAEQIKNQRDQIPYLLVRYGGIALIIICVGLGIKYANSYSKSIINEKISSNHANAATPLEDQDTLIDIESILESKKSFTEQSYDVPANTVTNYVMFDQVPFTNDGFTKVTTGRQYEDVNSEAGVGWCYIERGIGTESRNTFYLKRFDSEGLRITDLTKQVADNLDTSIQVLEEARELCTF